MKKLLVIVILLLSVFLRLHNYSIYPQRGATSDEYTYSFLGVSLINQHVPISWSMFEYKDKKDLTIKGIYFPIVKPYFDHPPFYGLVVGTWALLFKQDTFEKITLEVIRIVPIILATISSLLLFLIANRLYDFKTGIWALLIFDTVTIFVMNMRVSVAENLLAVLFLGAIYFFSKHRKKLNTKIISILGILCGLALLTKILGITLFFSMLYLLINERLKPRLIKLFVSTFLIFPALLLSYAAIFDWNLFWQIQSAQGGRFIGPETLLNLLQNPVIVNKVIPDGWYFLGFFALFHSLFDNKNKIITIPSLFYFLALFVSLTNQGFSGWYMIPLFPFMAMSIARLIVESIRNMNFGIFVFLLFVGSWHIQNLFKEPFGLTSPVFRTFIFLLFVPLIIFQLFSNKKAFSIIGNGLFYFMILCNIIATFTYTHPS